MDTSKKGDMISGARRLQIPEEFTDSNKWLDIEQRAIFRYVVEQKIQNRAAQGTIIVVFVKKKHRCGHAEAWNMSDANGIWVTWMLKKTQRRYDGTEEH